jgi:hypothetical protein
MSGTAVSNVAWMCAGLQMAPTSRLPQDVRKLWRVAAGIKRNVRYFGSCFTAYCILYLGSSFSVTVCSTWTEVGADRNSKLSTVGLHPTLKFLLTVLCWTASILHNIINFSHNCNEVSIFCNKQEDRRGDLLSRMAVRLTAVFLSTEQISVLGLSNWSLLLRRPRNLLRPSVRLTQSDVRGNHVPVECLALPDNPDNLEIKQGVSYQISHAWLQWFISYGNQTES